MSKYKWRQRKARKAERAEKEQRKLRRQAPYVVIAQRGCGCCNTDVMHFKSKASARAAFEQAGLTSSGGITDDLGVFHRDVDTFYGFRAPEEPTRSIDYLLKRLGGTV